MMIVRGTRAALLPGDVLLSSLGAVAGDPIVVSPGVRLIADIDTPVGGLGPVSVSSGGTLVHTARDFIFEADDVMNDGTWNIIAADNVSAFTNRAQIIIKGARGTHTARPNNPTTGVQQGTTNDGLKRAINNHGTRNWKGVPKTLPKTKLKATAAASQATLVLEGNCSDWVGGDEIIVAPTNYAGQSNAERRTLATVGSYNSGANTTTVTVTVNLTESHYGVLQYPIDAAFGSPGMSLTAGTFTAPNADVPTVYDARAEVINISNGNITVEAPNDSAWSTQGWGVHMMDHYGSTFYDEGVRVIRGGQRGALGRYPFHAHSLSYQNTTAAVTLDISGPRVIVNYTGHGITKTTTRGGTVTFSNDSGLLKATFTGTHDYFYSGVPVSFSGGTLPSNIVSGLPYQMAQNNFGSNTFWVANVYSEDPPTTGSPGILAYVNSGSGTINADTSISNQPLMFATTGSLPAGLAVGSINTSTAQPSGSRYYVVGSSITTNSFCISTTPNGPAIDSSGSQSGTHTALTTRFTSDRADCKRVKCTVDTSENRALTIHASCGTEVTDFTAYDIKGQAVFFEDGSELRNKLYRSTVAYVRNPAEIDRLKKFDGVADSDGNYPFFQSSGIWLSNPLNDIVDNIGILCDGHGIHNSFGSACFGISALVNEIPATQRVLRWDGNGGHSNWKRGIVTNSGVTDEFGESGAVFTPGSYAVNVEFGLEDNLMRRGWAVKNRQGAYQNTVNGVGPFYKSWTVGDNQGGNFEGNTSNTILTSTSHLMVGFSLMPGKTADITSDTLNSFEQPVGVFGNATYHFTLPFKNCAYVNFTLTRPRWRRGGQQDYTDGGVSWRDLYTQAVGVQRKFSTGNVFPGSHPGGLSRAPRLAGYPVTLTIANPCVVTIPLVDAPSGTYEFYTEENAPVFFTRTTGTLPTALGGTTTLGTEIPLYVKNYGVPGVGKFNLSLTPGGAAISTSGQSQSGIHAMHPRWRGTNQPVRNGIGTTMPDPERNYGSGATGSTARWVCPYGDNPFFTTSAADSFNCESSINDGLFGLGFSTTTPFMGMYAPNTQGHNVAGENHIGFYVIRVAPTTLSYIGEVSEEAFDSGTESGFFQDFNSTPLLCGGWYKVRPGKNSGITVPTTFSAVRLTGGQETGANLMIGIWFSGGVTPTSVFRTLGGGGGGASPSSPSGGTGESVTCTAASGVNNAAKLAAVAADATGSLYWQDTANDLVWMRHVPLPLNASLDAYYASLPDSVVEKGEKTVCLVVRT